MTATDPALATLIRSHDPRALEHLYRAYRSPIWRFCHRLLGTNEDADDATQATFLKAGTGLHGLDHPEALTAWLYTIARNESYALLRKQRPGRISLDDVAEDVWEAETPLDLAERSDLLDAVETALQALSPPYREVIILRIMDGMSYAEIADVTGSTLSAVESRLFKARQALTQRLSPVLPRHSS